MNKRNTSWIVLAGVAATALGCAAVAPAPDYDAQAKSYGPAR